ncbi:hypothetical protein H0H87_011847 [Tephrocybe sp. NHM501043]|nr:hypothetical protein H0H87_011847 [Tephrocybe sp. NHM501043]
MAGVVRSILEESFPRAKPTFSVGDIPDLTGKVVIVTGSNSYVASYAALLAHNAKVYMAARSPDKARASIAELNAETGKEAFFLQLNLADLKSVKIAATTFLEKEKELHILINNGGITTGDVNEFTPDGYDLQMGTNVIGHFYFTKLLLPILVATAQTSDEKHVRVLTLSSVTHHYGSLNFDTFKDSSARRKVTNANVLYAQSKLGNLVFAVELAHRYGKQGVVSMAVNPGNIGTHFADRALSPFGQRILALFQYPPPLGALTQLWGATSKEGAEFNGKYLAPWTRLGSPQPTALDPKLGNELWEWLDEQVKDL